MFGNLKHVEFLSEVFYFLTLLTKYKMQRKQKFLIIIIILDILLISFFLSFAGAPQLYLKNKLIVSETLEPPANFELQLNPGHEYFAEVVMQRAVFPCDLELNLKLDNSTFKKFHFIRTRSSMGAGPSSLYCLIPVDIDTGGFFEIEVINSEEVIFVEYKIYQDVPDFLPKLDENGEGFAFFFVVILVLCILWNKEELKPIYKKLGLKE